MFNFKKCKKYTKALLYGCFSRFLNCINGTISTNQREVMPNVNKVLTTQKLIVDKTLTGSHFGWILLKWPLEDDLLDFLGLSFKVHPFKPSWPAKKLKSQATTQRIGVACKFPRVTGSNLTTRLASLRDPTSFQISRWPLSQM